MEFSARRGVSRFSVLCGFVTMDFYWLYLICLSHAINPVSVFVMDTHSGRHLRPGQIGSLVATLAWSEVRMAVLASLIVFALATLVADAARKMLASSGFRPSHNGNESRMSEQEWSGI